MTTHILAAMTEELQAFARSPFRTFSKLGIESHVHIDFQKVFLGITGVGKVNAAIAAMELQHSRTSCSCTVLFVGTAAACDPSLEIGDVVISTDTLHHDVDVTTLGFEPGQIPFHNKLSWESSDELRSQAVQACEKLGIPFKVGRIITGDQFVADPIHTAQLHRKFSGACIDMETAGFAQAMDQSKFPPMLRRRGLRWLGIRVISDKADKSAPVDFTQFLPRASETLARIVEHIIAQDQKENT